MDHDDNQTTITVAALDEMASQLIDLLNDRIIAYDERAAIQAESREAEFSGKTTTDFAIEALRRPEKFRFEHDVARGWLRENARAGGKQSA